jgi:molybdenum cofactor cytidylyltransferase
VIGGLVLAAGRGTRFGGAKVLAAHDEVPLVRHAVNQLVAAGIGSVVVTAGEHAAEIVAALVGTPTTVVQVDPAGEMSASLRAGVLALSSECAAFVVALGDQPGVDPAVVRALVETWEGSTSAAVVPVYRGAQGHPVLFDATMRRRFGALVGDRGGRDLLADLGDRVVWMPVDADVPVDVDTMDDLRRLL